MREPMWNSRTGEWHPDAPDCAPCAGPHDNDEWHEVSDMKPHPTEKHFEVLGDYDPDSGLISPGYAGEALICDECTKHCVTCIVTGCDYWGLPEELDEDGAALTLHASGEWMCSWCAEEMEECSGCTHDKVNSRWHVRLWMQLTSSGDWRCDKHQLEE